MVKSWINAILILAFFFAESTFAGKPTLTWILSVTDHLPESHRQRLVTKDSYLLRLMIESMPEYRHQVQHGNVARIVRELKTRPRSCFPGSSTNARKEFAHLTSFLIFPTPLVVTRKEIAEKFKTSDGKISLGDLVTNRGLRGMVVDSRSYGPEVDKILYSSESKVESRSTNAFASSILDMIRRHRVDYTVEYGFIVEALSQGLSPTLVTVPISKVKPFNQLYILCSRTPEGREAVKRIDEVIRNHILTPEYKSFIMLNAPEGESRAFFEKAADEFAKHRSKNVEVL